MNNQPPSNQAKAWADAFNSPLGVALLAEQEDMLDEQLSCLFGYYLLQMSVNPNICLFKNSRVQCAFQVAQVPAVEISAPNPSISLFARNTHLPFADASLDVVLLHHELDSTQQPHQLLKEASRVLLPKGYVVIVGFNPWSLMGLIKPFMRMFSRCAFWRCKSISLARLCDWLQFLDFTVTFKTTGFMNVPLNHTGYLMKTKPITQLLQRLGWPLGSFYCVVARKDVLAVTPIKPQWKRKILVRPSRLTVSVGREPL